jgi:hypothetical protein
MPFSVSSEINWSPVRFWSFGLLYRIPHFAFRFSFFALSLYRFIAVSLHRFSLYRFSLYRFSLCRFSLLTLCLSLLALRFPLLTLRLSLLASPYTETDATTTSYSNRPAHRDDDFRFLCHFTHTIHWQKYYNHNSIQTNLALTTEERHTIYIILFTVLRSSIAYEQTPSLPLSLSLLLPIENAQTTYSTRIVWTMNAVSDICSREMVCYALMIEWLNFSVCHLQSITHHIYIELGFYSCGACGEANTI